MNPAQALIDSSFGIEGQTAIVTGAGSGIGKATARLFAAAGANVIVADLILDTAQATVADIEAAGGKALAVQCDIADESAVQALIEQTASHFGGLDILVNNAAFRGKHDFMEMSVADWDRMFDVTMRGTFLCSREAIRRMRAQGRGGSIVNVSSVTAQHTMIFSNAHYAAAKAGVESLTRSAAVEFAPDGIRVNCVAPGGTDTEGSRNIQGSYAPKGPATIPGRNLMGRKAQPHELANAIYFFASPASSYITGQVLAVDGGFMVG